MIGCYLQLLFSVKNHVFLTSIPFSPHVQNLFHANYDQTKMSNFEEIPILDVHKGNFIQIWPSILLAVKTSSFIAIDTELSGLGDRKAINARNVDERYKAMSEAAKTRSIISFGISCFQRQDSDENLLYLVQTFNLTTLCSDEYTVEPAALKFLVDHGFDFNKQYAQGIPYYKGNDKTSDENDQPSLRRLFLEIARSGKHIVLHNAMIDLLFIYQSWYADLPPNLASFLKDVHQIYSGEIYDTKFIAEFKARTPASYLEYIFRRLQRENEITKTSSHRYVELKFLKHDENLKCVEYKNLGIETTGDKTVPTSNICMSYANHGWCANGHNCALSHNVDCVLDMETCLSGKKRKRKCRSRHRKKKQAKMSSDLNENEQISNGDDDKHEDEVNDIEKNGDEEEDVSKNARESVIKIADENGVKMADIKSNGDCKLEIPVEKDENEIELNEKQVKEEEKPSKMADNAVLKARLKQKSSCHRAGCDAFMTGFVMAVFLSRSLKKKNLSDIIEMTDYVNKIYLSGKDVPLIIQESSFAKNSKNHLEKFKRLKNSDL